MMTDYDKLVMLRAMVEDAGVSDDTLYVYLTLAGEEIIRKAYPYDDTQSIVPPRYGVLQCEIAAYLFNKRGAEGQTAHSENGISRQYARSGVPESMLSAIVPYVGVI